ncbi:hypothetical protein ENUP19_0298G0109 [Entamoeba nuttalli]|uniref:Uncharacterized protein n=2 Tax=Entamoeba nuttalli TaxID=412467 RepID=K2G9E0_ENTNP|nr:hypothetical protein ENU1_142410 [Entamoeba nuttalli P19]EKE39076.1 hypothetical protein ENU1_142410 [Entamoeba nuttalli P19]|eukprot:XP_008858590.1 hypothetical protein ENU1_142410 [Entamoeba nuttalli P19]
MNIHLDRPLLHITQQKQVNAPKRGKGYSSVVESYSYRDIRKYQCCEQAILIGVLNLYYNITVQFGSIRTPKSSHFLKILYISDNNDVIEVEKLIRDRIELINKDELKQGCSFKTALKRTEGHKIRESLHLLIDICELNGIKIEVQRSGMKKDLKRCDIVTSVVTDSFTLTKEEIISKGSNICSYLFSCANDKKECYLPRNETVLSSLLF